MAIPVVGVFDRGRAYILDNDSVGNINNCIHNIHNGQHERSIQKHYNHEGTMEETIMIRKLSERTDAAGVRTKQMVEQMIVQIAKLKEIKSEVLKKKSKAISEVNQSFRAEIKKIEKDIYVVENGIKAIAGAKEYHRIKKEMKEAASRKSSLPEVPSEKPKDIYSDNADSNIDNNNNNTKTEKV